MGKELKETFDSNYYFEKELGDFGEIKIDIYNFLKDNYDPLKINDLLDKMEDELENKQILKFSYNSPNISFKIKENGKEKNIIFNLNEEKFYSENELNEKLKEIPKKLEKGGILLSAMEEIFFQNQKEFFGEINDKDVLKTDIFNKNGLNITGKNLRDLQIIYRENQKELFDLPLNEKQKKDFLNQQKQYVNMFVGIGDEYEGGATYLLETEKHFNQILYSIVKNSSLTELFTYMAMVHQKMDQNNWQSISVKKSYKIFIDQLNSLVLNRLKKENAKDEDFVTFSKLLIGKGSDIDDDLRNSALATESLMYVFTRKGGGFEKLNIKDLDKSLFGVNVSDKIKELEEEFKKAGIEVQNDMSFILLSIGFGRLSNNKEKNYKDLDFEAQTELSVLNKFIKKFKRKRQSYDRRNKKNILDKNKINWGEEIRDILKEVSSEYIEESQDEIERLFSSNNIFNKSFWTGKKAEDFGLIGSQKEAYELFVNMNGIGLLNISDTTKSGLKLLGQIGVVLVASVCATIITGGGSLALQGAVAGAVGSGASWIAFPRGYDTKKEAVVDLTSDVIIGTGTGAIGGKLTEPAIREVSKLFGNGATTKSVVTGTDIALLGFVPEFWRIGQIEKKFHGQGLILSPEEYQLSPDTDDLALFYQKINVKK
ncbi:hypothetical protein BLD25_02945 [Candidatus Gracilibacteria bacterium GN02-872]|nr:hypothetical protein BLD25_02945 [Candidatus Gracilibacteria bacterium GN02-872]